MSFTTSVIIVINALTFNVLFLTPLITDHFLCERRDTSHTFTLTETNKQQLLSAAPISCLRTHWFQFLQNLSLSRGAAEAAGAG